MHCTRVAGSLLIGMWLLGARPACAQDGQEGQTATVMASVEDINGSALPDAVVALRESGRIVATAVADSHGRAEVARVGEGTYDVVVNADGFAEKVIRIDVRGALVRTAIRLTPRIVEPTVTVTAKPGSVQGSRLDIPLIELPQAVQVVSQKTLEDQQVVRIGEAARNVSGVTRAIGYNDAADKYTIRGFLVDYSLKNGFKHNSLLTLTDVANIERVEVLKGPSSIIQGRLEPGGVVNAITKEPPAAFSLSGQILFNSEGFARPSIDVGGPLRADKRVLFRLNAAYDNGRSHREGIKADTTFIAPVLTVYSSEATVWRFEGEHLELKGTPDAGLPLDVISLELPLSRNLGEPGHDRYRNRNSRVSYSVSRQLSHNVLLTSAFSALWIDSNVKQTLVSGPGFLNPTVIARAATLRAEDSKSYFQRFDLSARVPAGSIEHTVNAGLEAGWEDYSIVVFGSDYAPIDILRPAHGAAFPNAFSFSSHRDRSARTIGLFLQDHLALSNRWKLLLGGRVDIVGLSSSQQGCRRARLQSRLQRGVQWMLQEADRFSRELRDQHHRFPSLARARRWC